ncbi:fructose-6-phosphate aldolase, partial [Candidatus Dependentiae bacterium]|nr:fructose-6-phosphate aldolase [Candidatus Dependentiae bacterium]
QDTYGFKTQLLAASLRSPLHVHDAALAGADVATLPPTLFDLLLKHPLTDKGLLLFEEDWQKTHISIFP